MIAETTRIKRGLLASVALLTPFAVLGQSAIPAPTHTFEVATIKPTTRTDGAWKLQATPDGYTGMDISLLHLIMEAYGTYDTKLISGGPAWINTTKFDLEAKFNPAEILDAAKMNRRQRADMLQPLLADRFKLRLHHELKQFPVYNLVVAKDGPKFEETPNPVDHGFGSTCFITRKGYTGCGIESLTMTLRGLSGRTVIDKTGLTGKYDFNLSATSVNAATTEDPNAPDVFTAVQEQLGLKLEPGTAAIDTLVIDSAEPPSAN